MWCSLCFVHPSLEIRNPNEARAWAASKMPFSPLIFNRQSDGVLSQNLAFFAVMPFRDLGVQILGYGKTGVTELCNNYGNLKTAFTAQYEGGEVIFSSGSLGITRGNFQTWRCTHFVIQSAGASRKNVWTRYQADKAMDLAAIAEPLFRKSLEKRLSMIEGELPEGIEFSDFKAISSPSPAWAGEMPQFAVTLQFQTNAEFHGPWHIGRLSNKGCGHIARGSIDASRRTFTPVNAGGVE